MRSTRGFVSAFVVLAVSQNSIANPLRAREDKSLISFDDLERAPGYITVFDDPSYTVKEHLGKIGKNFTYVELPQVGYWANLTGSQLAAVRSSDDKVFHVEENAYIEVDEVKSGTTSRLLRPRDTQADVGWGLAALSEKKPFDNSDNLNDDTYHFLGNSGQDVDVYVVDSGVSNIAPFEGRVSNDKDYTGQGMQDQYGHGTMVASVVGSNKFGAAKKPNIHSYKVYQNPPINLSWMYNALVDIKAANAARKSENDYRGAVVVMSLGGASLPVQMGALERSINALYNDGVLVIVSAGNDHVDASGRQPCSFQNTICVGGIDDDYHEYGDSNFGSAVNILAPADRVSVFKNDGSEDSTVQGTSIAAPYVAGIVATYFGWEGKDLTIERIKTLLFNKNAEKDVLKEKDANTPNLLANNGYQKHAPYVDAPDQPAAGQTAISTTGTRSLTGVSTTSPTRATPTSSEASTSTTESPAPPPTTSISA